MTREKYIEMHQQLGDEVDWDKAPVELDDFPTYVHQAMEIFNCLPDTYSGGMEPIYSGKDLASFSMLANEVFEVEKFQDVFRVVSFLDYRAKEKAINAAKKSASSGKGSKK